VVTTKRSPSGQSCALAGADLTFPDSLPGSPRFAPCPLLASPQRFVRSSDPENGRGRGQP
jgi:hypothetical protein